MTQKPTDVTTMAYHWIVQRPDGAGFGATSHDRQLDVGSTTLEPDMDMQPSEMVLTDEMFGSSLELAGGFSSRALTKADLIAERWNGSSISLLAGDWESKAEVNTICEGQLRQVQVDGGKLTMSVDVIPATARQPPCIHTSPECRAVLGDAHCRVDMRTRKRRVRITAVANDSVTVDASDTASFAMGQLRWISGAHCGVQQPILVAEGSKLVLHDFTRLAITVGDRAVLSEGCDGRRVTCFEKFRNVSNFRGEPDLPGSEILFRFPGA